MYKSKNILNYIIVFIVAFIVFSDSVLAGSLCAFQDDKGNSFAIEISDIAKTIRLRDGAKLADCTGTPKLSITYNSFRKETGGYATCDTIMGTLGVINNEGICTITSSGDFKLVGNVAVTDWQESEKEVADCKDILGDDFIDFLNKIFRWVQIIAPIIVIVLGSVDFASALLQDDKDALKKASNKLIKRLIIAIALFLLPILIRFLLNNFNAVKGANAGTCGIGE